MNTTTLKSGIVTALMAIMSLSAFAKDDVVVDNYRDTDYAIVSAKLSTNDAYNIVIKDDNGELVYRSPRMMNNQFFQRLIDLKSMDNGMYHIFVVGNDTRLLSSFEVKNNLLVKAPAQIKPDVDFLLKDNDMLYVRQVNPSKTASRMEIVDQNGQVVYANVLPSKEVYNGVYKVSDLPKGKYVVSIASGVHDQHYEFSK